MRVLLDTDVNLDFILQRQPFFVEAKQIFLSLTQGTFTGYISAVTHYKNATLPVYSPQDFLNLLKTS